jgi:hypothetical protein
VAAAANGPTAFGTKTLGPLRAQRKRLEKTNMVFFS